MPKSWPKKLKGKSWTVGLRTPHPETITEKSLRKFYEAVPKGSQEMCKALGVAALSSRKADRALQLLKKEGLIIYKEGEWRQT